MLTETSYCHDCHRETRHSDERVSGLIECTECSPLRARTPLLPQPTHWLKSWVGLFEPILTGRKLYDLRVLDRDYRVGDTCRLREFDPLKRAYTGREVTVEITYITSGSGQEGHQACAASPVALHPATGILGYRLVQP